MQILTIVLVILGLLTFAKAFLVARGVRVLKLKNETINSWLSITALLTAAAVFTMNKPNYLLLFPVLNLLLLFAFYLQPTFRVSKYLAYIYIPANILFCVLLSI